ncbi:MAG: sulfur oxidation c-type cytochrome SoxX [Marivivens sp.]|jgi:sulfur-oxidizing protein SoxX|uniref:sulfur oxidation c-type cytochrome SoxX n=1 Tax=Marivivens sp. TaxID=1978374 RepID=UPI001832E45F|nr:sulfur oxidation c-type cytochrome SoxX [Marivivens sp.]MCL7407186.1 sulfur oxidation c-type cytochrome SoxX [Marivivens geojensis]NBQ49292.1 sulfur oxidation c-type cytochrome SoxX [Marivivens sp.]NBT50194.1 sulfur oxidation c-type cytochrome SoxX [Marivivens sp.]NBX08698.1 sulfur oxidation c-type cytochrome SoxX [Marivivens sp.]NCW67397.1 sulfur oxidation c-type cytochrome SoxX [Marivivens sp.]
MKSIIQMAVGLAVVASVASADEVAPDAVVFDDYGAVEQSLTGVAGNVENGIVIMTNRGKGNCIACHQVDALADYPFHGEVGPALNGVGGYRTEAELRGIVANAKHTFPDTVMPSFYKTSGYTRPGDAFTGKAGAEPLAPLLTAQEIEDVVAYLLTLTD